MILYDYNNTSKRPYNWWSIYLHNVQSSKDGIYDKFTN